MAMTRLALGLAGMLALSGCNDMRPAQQPAAGDPAPNSSTADRARRETSEAVDAVTDHATVKRDELQKRMEEELAKADEKMNELSEKIKTASGEAKEKLQKEWDELEPKRQAARERLEELKKSSAKAWEDIKGGAQSAFEDLRTSVKAASSRFEDEKVEK